MDNQNELDRMRVILEGTSWPLIPYAGRTDDIDITKEPLFCPNCEYEKPLLLNERQTSVTCINPSMLPPMGDYCEYSYDLTEERIRKGIFWSNGFQYPRTRREVLERQLKGRTQALSDIPNQRELEKARLDQREKELVEEIANIQNELEKQDMDRGEL